MVRKYDKKHGFWYHQGPYTDDELYEFFYKHDQTPVSFTHPGPGPVPAAQDKPQDPPETAPEEQPAKARLNGE